MTRSILPRDMPSKKDAERILVPLAREIRDELAGRFPEHAARLREVVFLISPRMHRTLGRAYPGGFTVKLSRILAMPDNRAEAEDTIRHELGHMVLPPGTGHGLAWQALGRHFGYKATRYTDRLEVVARRPVRRRKHTCTRCGSAAHLTIRKSNQHVDWRFQAPDSTYGFYHLCDDGKRGLLSTDYEEVTL